MKLEKEQLIQDLVERTRIHLNEVERFMTISLDELNFRASEEKWSALECIEHLNRYGEFYIPEISKQLKKAKPEREMYFKSGVLGNYFSESMLPKAKLNTMKTFKVMNPLGSHLDKTTLEKFISQQKQILELLSHARKKSLTKTKTAISISKLIKLRLGDTFRVVVFHNERHLVQANTAISISKKTKEPIKSL